MKVNKNDINVKKIDFFNLEDLDLIIKFLYVKAKIEDNNYDFYKKLYEKAILRYFGGVNGGKNKIQLILLGQMNNKVANGIKIYKLTKIVKTFNHYVGEKDMEKYMSGAHYAIISTYKESIYGRYKISGSFGDAVAFNVPIILSENYTPDYKSKNIIKRFKNDRLDVLLNKLLITK